MAHHKKKHVHPVPPGERRAAYGFATFADGLDACRRVVRRGATPAVLRLYDDAESKRNFDVDDHHVLLVLDEGDDAVLDGVMRVVDEECNGAAHLDGNAAARREFHRVVHEVHDHLPEPRDIAHDPRGHVGGDVVAKFQLLR